MQYHATGDDHVRNFPSSTARPFSFPLPLAKCLVNPSFTSLVLVGRYFPVSIKGAAIPLWIDFLFPPQRQSSTQIKKPIHFLKEKNLHNSCISIVITLCRLYLLTYLITIWGELVPSDKLTGMCRWTSSHFHDQVDYNGVTFSIKLMVRGRSFSGFWGLEIWLSNGKIRD